MPRGAVSRLQPNLDRGYLVQPRFGAAEIVFRARDLEDCRLDQLAIGQEVEFDVEADARGVWAVRVRLVTA
jgi:cold shock CspA family protein